MTVFRGVLAGLVVSFRGLVRAGVRAGRALGAGCSEPCLGALEASRAAVICVPAQSIVSKNALQYRGSAQHDAQEFLLWLLDRVHEDLHQAAAQGQGGPPPAKVRARGHPGDGDARGTGTPGAPPLAWGTGTPGGWRHPGAPPLAPGTGTPGGRGCPGPRHSSEEPCTYFAPS